jgi:siderophore synthetase component
MFKFRKQIFFFFLATLKFNFISLFLNCSHELGENEMLEMVAEIFLKYFGCRA